MPATARNFMDNIAEAIEDIFPDKDNTGKAYKAMHSVLNAPSDYEGMTVGDVLDSHEELVQTLLGLCVWMNQVCNIFKSQQTQDIFASLERHLSSVQSVLTHNGQPIRRCNET
jgi:hypothetical protein